MKLRNWQNECIDLAFKHYLNQRHFLCLATPAAGKTIMSASLAKKLFVEDKIDFVICFSPSVTTAENARDVFERVMSLKFDGLFGSVGRSMTYQAMLHLDYDFWDILKSHRVFIVFDEIHHCAGSEFVHGNAWGQSILNNIKDKAEFILAMSGTPWRSDSLPITLTHYADSNGRISTHYRYGLARAISDKVCRVPQITLIDNDKILVTHKSEQSSYRSFQELFNQKVVSYSELLHNKNALKYILQASVDKLASIRESNPNAAGLVVATSVSHAQIIQKLMKKEFGQIAEIVSYKTENSAKRISRFKESSAPWIISIGMISEGTDIPRLQVCCHLSRVKTELYFRQIIGRILRVTGNHTELAWLYTFAEPNLSNYAQRLNQDIPNYNVILNDKSEINKLNLNPAVTENLKSSNKKPSPVKSNNTTDNILLELNSKAVLTAENTQAYTHWDILGHFRQQLIHAFQSPF
ncbi:DEAD/DEAH box helicase family protein [Catenovulum sp. 2E275]|uniref:DEAD/DEAH box helicase n=1 Tax=Catenovulum sp. 2E275 TaxID=2980497 RepID=UPI0021D25EE5|nr:DEAD/DEAH box helicase family protein [Catenovulum sp. 2E275]MCU4677479.1 DEAD/DEAH box helicase family protein [Catenovulum sp. 2E275]